MLCRYRRRKKVFLKLDKAIAKAIVDALDKHIVIAPATNPTPNQSATVKKGDDWDKRLQEECNSKVSLNKCIWHSGPATLAGCPVLKKGAKGNITKLLQEKLVKLGYSTNGVDGIFGNGALLL